MNGGKNQSHVDGRKDYREMSARVLGLMYSINHVPAVRMTTIIVRGKDDMQLPHQNLLSVFYNNPIPVAMLYPVEMQ